jgi:hypothetical protein
LWEGIIALIGNIGLEGKVEEAARRGGIHDGARLSRGKGEARYGRRSLHVGSACQ